MALLGAWEAQAEEVVSVVGAGGAVAAAASALGAAAAPTEPVDASLLLVPFSAPAAGCDGDAMGVRLSAASPSAAAEAARCACDPDALVLGALWARGSQEVRERAACGGGSPQVPSHPVLHRLSPARRRSPRQRDALHEVSRAATDGLAEAARRVAQSCGSLKSLVRSVL